MPLKRDGDIDESVFGFDVNLSRLAYIRMRCLEIAVQSGDPDSSVDMVKLTALAETLFIYVTKGERPAFKGLTETQIAEAFNGPEIDTAGPMEHELRADLHFGDPSLRIPRQSDEVRTVDRREHPPQDDDDSVVSGAREGS